MKKTLATLLLFILIFASFSQAAFAYNFDGKITSSGTYTFASNERPDLDLTDTFEYRDDCFRIEAPKGCCHLAKLSARVCEASVGDYSNPDSLDPSHNSDHIEAMLSDMGFSDVKVNNYYNKEKLRNSIGCAVGHRTIKDGDKEYTLLAIFPEGGGYKQEWCGNLTTGKEGLHQGFKEARDEVLRFVKKYVKDQGISGDVKIWTAGHSRGGAIANFLAGFFVEDTDDYFGSISITPEDVYCYTFGTPKGVPTHGLTKEDALSVSGPRGGAYADDTPGSSYTYSKSDAASEIDPHSGAYAGIRAFAPEYDLYAQLALTNWGFTSYGTILDPEDGASKDRMLEELAKHSEYAYKRYTENDRDDCTYYTFDAKTMSIVPDTSAGSLTQSELVKGRLDAISALIKDREEYVDGGYQETLAALASTYALIWNPFQEAIDPKGDYGSLALPIVSTYLAYASDQLQSEGRADNEGAAIAIALEGLIGYVSGSEIPEDATVDDLIYRILKYIRDPVHKDGDSFTFDSDYAQTIFDTIAKAVYKQLNGHEPASDAEMAVARAFEYNLLVICVDLPSEEAHDNRVGLYNMLMSYLPDEYKIFAIEMQEGDRDCTDYVDAILPNLLNVLGGDEKTYNSISDVADDSLGTLLITAYQKAIDAGFYDESSEQYKNLIYYRDTLANNIPTLRKVLSYFLFYESGETFDTASVVRTACTFVNNGSKTVVTHYKEGYLAWVLAHDCEEHEPEKKDDPKKDDPGASGYPDPDDKTNGNKDNTKVKSSPGTGDDDWIPYLLMIPSAAAGIALIRILQKRRA